MADREMLVNALDNGKEFFETQVNGKESQITKSIKSDQDNTENGLIDGKHKRNRGGGVEAAHDRTQTEVLAVSGYRSPYLLISK